MLFKEFLFSAWSSNEYLATHKTLIEDSDLTGFYHADML